MSKNLTYASIHINKKIALTILLKPSVPHFLIKHMINVTVKLNKFYFLVVLIKYNFHVCNIRCEIMTLRLLLVIFHLMQLKFWQLRVLYQRKTHFLIQLKMNSKQVNDLYYMYAKSLLICN